MSHQAALCNLVLMSLQAALSDAGITPSDSRTYGHDEVAGAIEDAFGTSVRLHCDGNGHLTEVWGVRVLPLGKSND